MSKYTAESFYTCLFKITHALDEISNESLKNLEKRKDGKFELIDIKFNKRKTRSTSEIKSVVTNDKKNSEIELEKLIEKTSLTQNKSLNDKDTIENFNSRKNKFKLNKDKLKIGYFSSDFHSHPVSHLIKDVFKDAINKQEIAR